MKKNIQEQIIELVKAVLQESGLGQGLSEDLYLDIPADFRFGDFSTNIALRLSKPLHKSPREVADALAKSFYQEAQKTALKESLEEIKVEGPGFINFYLNAEYHYGQLREILLRGQDALRSNLGKQKRVLVEFVSANPTGSLSVAHARQAAVGDSLANILEFLGFKAQREYYLNDVGNQINILAKSVGLRIQELAGEKIEFPEDHYQGEYIYEIAK